jgi:GDSL-like Lipase/Acylhydrolase family
VRAALKACLLVVLSVGLTLLGVELVLPLFVDVTDGINWMAVPGVGLGYRPNQEGRYIRPGIDARFHINGSGFNNPHEYTTARVPGVRRIALVGDSYVEAFQVNPEDALYSVLESKIAGDGLAAEVYSFGISGFGTAQILRLVQDTVLSYTPDLVIYLFISNDVADSSACLERAEFKLQYDLSDDGRLLELPAARYELSWWKGLIRQSRLMRYLFVQRKLIEMIQGWSHPPVTAAARSTGPCAERSWKIVDALLGDLQQRLSERGIPLLVVWEGDNDTLKTEDVREGLERIAAKRQIALVDLTAALNAEGAKTGRSFRIAGDGHWNADGHRVAGTVLAPVVERVLAEPGP